MFLKLSSSIFRSTILPISTKPIFKLLSYHPQSLCRLLSSSLTMSDSPISPSIPTSIKPELFRSLKFHMGSCFSNDPIAPPPNPLIIVISEASGVGKDASINKLQQVRQSLHSVVKATILPMRSTEIDGKYYFFDSKDDFLSMVEKDELLEHALVYGDYKGIPKKQVQEYMSKGYDIVSRVDIQEAKTSRKILGSSAVFVFIVAKSELAMVERLANGEQRVMRSCLLEVLQQEKRLSCFLGLMTTCSEFNGCA